MNPTTFGDYSTRGRGIAWVLMPLAKRDDVYTIYEPCADLMRQYAERFKHFSFTYVDTVKFGEAVKILTGVEKREYPAVVLQVQPNSHLKYIYKGVLEKEPLDKFFNEYEAQTLAPNIKSEEIPEKPVVNNVFIAVGKTLTDLFFDDERDVMLFVHAPWCIQCNAIHDIWDKFGAKIMKEGMQDVFRVVKIDGMENDSPVASLKWSAFPMIYYSKAGEKESDIIIVDVEREARALWRFVKNYHSKKDELAQRKAALDSEGASEL